jgi:tryptophan-rich sensory protein
MVNIFKVNGKSNMLKAILFVAITEAIGLLGGSLGNINIQTYEAFTKPVFSPPAYLFPIVWAILYLLMGLAAYRIWEVGKQRKNVRKALLLYGIQLFFNFLWPILFFRLRLYGLAFLELMILLVFMLLTTFKFFKYDKLSAFMMIPYIAWVSFAGVLNFSIWYLNC